MKGILKLFLVIAVVFGVSSCTTVQQSTPVMAIAGNNISTNVKADIDYKSVKKVQGEATTNRILWIFKHTPGGNNTIKTSNQFKGLNNAEKVALYRAKKSADIDMILQPEFETYTKSYFFGIFKKSVVKATGWGVNIKGFSEGQNPNTVERFENNLIF